MPGRSDICHQCGADMKICLNCLSHDARVAHQCRDRRADPVEEKHMANFCEYFDFIRRPFAGRAEETAREQDARSTLRKLLGD